MPRSPEITRAGRGSFFVPRREGLVELTDLDRWIAPLLYEEASSGGAFRKAYAKADKIKIGALGNIVRQFHLHVVARLLAIALALALPGERPPRRIGERASALLPARKSPSVRGLDWRLSGARRQSAAGTGAGHHQRSADLRCRPGLPESQGRRLSSRIVAAALPAKPFANTTLRRGTKSDTSLNARCEMHCCASRHRSDSLLARVLKSGAALDPSLAAQKPT